MTHAKSTRGAVVALVLAGVAGCGGGPVATSDASASSSSSGGTSTTSGGETSSGASTTGTTGGASESSTGVEPTTSSTGVASTTAAATTTTSSTSTTGGPGFGCDAPIFADDFDDDAVGPYVDLVDWNDPPWSDGVDEGRVEIIEGADAFAGRSLRIHYPEGGVGPGEGGAQWKAALGAEYDELYVAYRVRFAPGFDFVLGGKLPGLVGGTAPTGCVDDTGGFSARSMWRAEGLGVQYMYYPEKVNNCGDDFDYSLEGAPALFQPGVWHTLEHHLVMNTPGQHDGHLEAWLDGQRVLDVPGFLFRGEGAAFAIDTLYFSTFFGGSGPEWGPTKDEAIDFDEFVVCAAPISH